MSEARTAVCAAVADILGLPIDAVDERSGIDVTDGWDSLQHLTIMMEIEQQLEVQFSPDDLADAKTVADILTLIGGA